MKKFKNVFWIIALTVLIALVPSKDVKAEDALAQSVSVENFERDAAAPSASITSISQIGQTTNSVTLSVVAVNTSRIVIQVKSTATYDYVPFTATASDSSITISGLASGMGYWVYITPYNVENVQGYSKTFYDAETLIAGVTNLQMKNYLSSSQKLYVSCDKISVADGFEWKLTNTSGKKLYSKVGGRYDYTYYIPKVKSNTIYNVSVRAIQEINGVKYTTPWTKLTCLPWVAFNKRVTFSDAGLSFSWKNVPSSASYVLYATDKKPTSVSSFKKVTTLKKGTVSYTLSKVKGKKVSSSKQYYIYLTVKYKGKELKPLNYGSIKRTYF